MARNGESEYLEIREGEGGEEENKMIKRQKDKKTKSQERSQKLKEKSRDETKLRIEQKMRQFNRAQGRKYCRRKKNKSYR